MFKNLRLSFKIAAGFGLVIVIMLVIGVIASINMTNTRIQSTILAEEYVPEVAISAEIEQSILMLMYEMRGYAFTEQRSFYDSALVHLSSVKNHIEEGKKLAATATHLVVFGDNIQAIERSVLQYESLMNDTVRVNDEIEVIRRDLDEAAQRFIMTTSEFLDNMESAMRSEISSDASNAALNERVWKIYRMNDVVDIGNDIRIANERFQLNHDERLINEGLRNFDNITAILNELDPTIRNSANQRQMTEIRNAVDEYKNGMLMLQSNWTEVDRINRARTETGLEAVRISGQNMDAGIAHVENRSQESATNLAASTTIVIVGLIIALIAGILLSFVIISSITKPINRIVDGLSQGAEQVTAASEQLSTSSQQLAEANSEQASSIQETSSTLEQSASMVQQNTENTKQAAMLSQKAKEASDKGNREMSEMMSSMDEIKKSSDQIAKIIKVIDEIAFQTNILALNAAVEAARAGDAGMGFAVVAEEVRNLAQRSAQAAKDTASIIENNIGMSQKGVEVAKKVGESLSEITLQSKKVNELMDEIAAASQEQSQGIAQINKAIAQMEKATQENAATAEESASSSEELSAQAENLKDMVSQLLHLVEGNNAMLNNTTRRIASTGPKKMIEGKNTKKTSMAHNYKSTGNSKTQIVNPNDVIPLDEDKDDF
ncbi:UNVERIFIED_CONTAM: methyl-accepting chemotaxis protein [Acetivibrio alkalicellulosi]